MHEAWDIILTLESFWGRLDNFKSHVMRGTSKKIKDEFMCLGGPCAAGCTPFLSPGGRSCNS